VDAYIVFEHSGDFSIAARKAVHAVFTLARQRDFPVRPVNAGFDLAGKRHPDAGLAGQSGGLCFALAFARKLLNLDLPDIAATGVIGSDGTISQVKGIDVKLRTALALLKENDRIFFPKDNQDQVPEDLISQIREKNIHLHPVSTLDQMIDILTDSVNIDTTKTDIETVSKSFPSNRLRLLALILLLTAACLAAGFQIWSKKTAPTAIPEESSTRSHTITTSRENTPLPAKTDSLNATQDPEITDNGGITDHETPVPDNKGFN
jgi:hypothetical protein